MVESAANVFESEEKEQRNGTPAAAPEDQAASEKASSSRRCPVRMYAGAPCGRPIHSAPDHDPRPVCLMHSRDLQKSNATFQKEIEAILNAAGNGIADFAKFVFPGAGHGEREFTAVCVFHSATFTRDARFYNARFMQYADFSRATFTHNADFRDASFTQKADFSRATFAHNAIFRGASFMQNADFSRVTVAHNAHFNNASFTQEGDFRTASFNGDADFFKTNFTRKAEFSSATFMQESNFYQATFTDNADFAWATFKEYVGFSKTSFVQIADFTGAKFLEATEFRETEFRGHDKDNRSSAQEFLPGPIFSLAEFSQPEAVTFYKTYLGQALFHNCDVSKLNFSSVEWRRRRGSRKRVVFEEEVDLTSAKDLRPAKDGPDERDYGLIAELYQQLKKNYDERKDYWTAGDFHYGELEMKRLASRRKNKVLRWLVQHLRLVAWYKYASHYGESYVRPAIWLGATLFFLRCCFQRSACDTTRRKIEEVPPRLRFPSSLPMQTRSFRGNRQQIVTRRNGGSLEIAA